MVARAKVANRRISLTARSSIALPPVIVDGFPMSWLPIEQLPANFAMVANCPIVERSKPHNSFFRAVALHPYLPAVFRCRRY